MTHPQPRPRGLCVRNPLTYGMTVALLALRDERIAMAADAAAPQAAQSTAVQELEISGVRPGPRLRRGSQGEHVLWLLGTLGPLPPL